MRCKMSTRAFAVDMSIVDIDINVLADNFTPLKIALMLIT